MGFRGQARRAWPRRLQRPPARALSSELAAAGGVNSGRPASPGLCGAARRVQQQERPSSPSQGPLLAKLRGRHPRDPPGEDQQGSCRRQTELREKGTRRPPLPLLAHSYPPAPKGLETPQVGRTLPPALVAKHLLCADLSRWQHLLGEATPAALGMEGENSHGAPGVPTRQPAHSGQGPRAGLHAVIRGRAPSGGTITRAAGPHGAGRCRRPSSEQGPDPR